MSDVVIIPKYLLERLLETVECNDPHNDYVDAVRAAIAENTHLMSCADAVLDRHTDTFSELNHRNRTWTLNGKYDLEAMKVMTMTLANPQTVPGLTICQELQEEGITQRREFWEQANAPIPSEPPTLGGLVSSLLKKL